jgi:hypothetical protein
MRAAWQKAVESKKAIESKKVVPSVPPDDATLSQHGRQNKFPEEPQFDRHRGGEREFEVSMIEGCLDCETVTRLVYGRPIQARDRVRYFIVRLLKGAG